MKKTDIKWDNVLVYFIIMPITSILFWYGIIKFLQWIF